MAVSTNSYFSRSIPGASAVGASIDLYSQDALPKYQIGWRVSRADGNEYVYGHFGAVTSAGFVVAPDLNESARAYSANVVITISSVFQMDDEPTGTYANMKNSRYMALDLGTGITASQFAGGYVGISSGTHIGYTYSIKDNKAASGSATVLELYDALRVAVGGVNDLSIGPCKYANLEAAIAATTRNSLAVGVALVDISTAGNYGFICCKGVTGVRQSGTIVQGNMAVLSDSDFGEVEALGLGAAASDTGSGLVSFFDTPVVGQCVMTSVTSGNAIIDVRL